MLSGVGLAEPASEEQQTEEREPIIYGLFYTDNIPHFKMQELSRQQSQ